MRHLGADGQAVEIGDRAGDEVLLGAVVGEAAFQLERQEGDLARERRGQQVVRVQVAHRVEGRRQLAVELPLGLGRGVGLPFESGSENSESLHGVHRVHRDFERQMRVVLVQQDQRLVDDELALRQGERAGGGEELGQSDGVCDVRVSGCGHGGASLPSRGFPGRWDTPFSPVRPLTGAVFWTTTGVKGGRRWVHGSSNCASTGSTTRPRPRCWRSPTTPSNSSAGTGSAASGARSRTRSPSCHRTTPGGCPTACGARRTRGAAWRAAAQEFPAPGCRPRSRTRWGASDGRCCCRSGSRTSRTGPASSRTTRHPRRSGWCGGTPGAAPRRPGCSGWVSRCCWCCRCARSRSISTRSSAHCRAPRASGCPSSWTCSAIPRGTSGSWPRPPCRCCCCWGCWR